MSTKTRALDALTLEFARLDRDEQRLLLLVADVLLSVADGADDVFNSAWLSEVAVKRPDLLQRAEQTLDDRGAA